MLVLCWKLSIFIIFLFYYTSNGQIVQVSPANLTSNPKKMLSGKVEGRLQSLKAKRPGGCNPLPSQWAVGPEGSPRWPNGVIKYYVDKDSYGYGIDRRLRSVLDEIMSGNSCPVFRQMMEKPTGEVGSWLHFTNPDRIRPCVHESGLDNNGEIKIVLGYDCLGPREIIHTVLHGLGFRDEVTHPQRDLFVRVMWENIQPAFRSMFRIQTVETNDASLMEYDPKSIMHFHERAYSLNGQPSIMPMLPGLRIEPSERLSLLDKKKITTMFSHECKKRMVGEVIEKACGAWHEELRGENRNHINGNKCPYVDNNNNVTDQFVVPGNDVKIEGDNSVGNGDQVVVPGNDVGYAEESHVGDAQFAVPGKDGHAEESHVGIAQYAVPGKDGGYAEESHVGVAQFAVPGNDVKVGDDAMASGIDDAEPTDVMGNDVKGGDLGKSKTINKLMGHGEVIPNQEAIVIGYD